ncbi:MAG: hypothetical protein MPEBLZ_01384 [Candidatus Methanoperedens nitroreducens]|uniref:Uncharacterized protein n=1 Tax=Candidatus Methanoperedens nitratireducens TaxID=1392998 RepID=A0A0P7ZJN4_9EURY|nr:MAG: hypothetical protein MPEBLZ_01384 [Candidatus Methanoperedens sp. BLZ1]
MQVESEESQKLITEGVTLGVTILRDPSKEYYMDDHFKSIFQNLPSSSTEPSGTNVRGWGVRGKGRVLIKYHQFSEKINLQGGPY